MARFQRFPSRPQSTRRKTTWVGGIQTAFTSSGILASASAIISAIDTRLGAVPEAPFTVIRIRGVLMIFSDQVVANEEAHGAYGVAVVNGEAFDIGVTAVPTPFTESFDDRWLYHTYWSAPSKRTAGEGMPTFWDNIVIDSKAMRKVNIGDVIVTVIENGSSVHGARFTTNKRTLVKLH